MGSRTPPKAKRLIAALTLGLFVLAVSGCDDKTAGGLADGPGHGQLDVPDRCATPQEGCTCDQPGKIVECGSVQRKTGGRLWCSVGHRKCADDLWGECEVEGIRELADASERSTQALGQVKACDNPCDPFCQQVVDSGSDLDLPPGLQQTPEGGITLLPKEGSLNDTGCTGIELIPTPQTLTVSAFAGGTRGLLGEYFDARFGDDVVPATAVPLATRIDPQIDVGYPTPFHPAFVNNGGDVTVRWTGWVKPAVSRAYQICMVSDDGVRVWLDDQLIIQNWSIHGAVEDCATVPRALNAGTLYKIRVELFNAYGAWDAHLRWKHADAPAGELIPSGALVPPGGEGQATNFKVDPPFAQFSARALPVGCFDGAIRAAWTVDRLDRASVDKTGRVSLFAPISGNITTTAYVGDFSASAVVQVKVNVLDAVDAPAGAAEKFAANPVGTDPMTALYPYVDTVFPLALRAPTIQWDQGGTAASAVMISLRTPATGAAPFVWSKVLPDAVPGRYTIPQDVWSFFEASGKGQTAAYSVQRITGNLPRPPVVRPFRFATAPVRGKIYYTQYGRNGSTDMMVADPGSPATATSVFPTDAGGTGGSKCPVCHSVSANGAMFATADRKYSANGGLSKINPDGSFTKLSDYSSASLPYRSGSNDWRGFAWAPLTPDGTLALAANNFWGNTRQQVVGIDQATRTVKIPGNFLSGGNGTGLLARYYLNSALSGWDFRRTDPKVDFDFGTGSPGGPVPPTFSVAWSGQIQAYTTETYTFSVQTTGGVQLAIGGNVLIDQLANATDTVFTAPAALNKGAKTAISLRFVDTSTDARVRLLWNSPSLGAASVVPQTQLYPNDGWHGLLATYYDNSDFTAPFISERLESNLDADWASAAPRPKASAGDGYWSAIFTGQLQAPATGDLAICASADDSVIVSVGAVERINKPSTSNGCSATFAVVEGAKYPIEVRYRKLGGDGHLKLSWQMSGATTFAREIVPSERLTPPAAWTPPSRGLLVTYYDNDDFNLGQGTNAKVGASTRIEENADLDWGNYRPEFSSAITGNDSFTSRFTGRLQAPCAGLYEFEVFGNDGGRLWLDDQRIVHLWSYGTQRGAIWLAAGLHDLKLEHREGAGNATVQLRWQAGCMGVNAFTPIPNANLYPTGDAGTGGYVLAGGDNGNDSSYFVWQTPTVAGADSVDVTASSPGRWGLGSTVMLLPSFAPDASKLVFVDGDSAGGNGWRKGLSVFSFDQANKLFKNRKTVLSTWPYGDVLKWPVFESDSRSVIYQATVPADMCCRKNWVKYGYVGPTNYFEDPGRLLSVDTQAATPAPVELTRLNDGERPLDRNKSYQATMLPQAAAGYRWAVFTSTRPYGNTLNLQGQQDFSDTTSYTYISEYGKLQSMLWVSAIDDVTSGAVDRSHPAFFLPNQNFNEDAANGFSNERAFWVTEACRPAGAGPESSCDVDEDCCGGSAGSAVCRVDTPPSSPPTRHCFQLRTPANCSMSGSACATSNDCCAGSICDDGTCVKPPAFAKFAPANFERVYVSNCGTGKKVDWTFLDYKASVPEVGGALEFFAESSDDPATFHNLPVYPSPVTTTSVASLGTQGPPGDLTKWTRIALDQPLSSAKVVERKYLKITVRFVPSQTGIAAPVLTEWRQSFSCPPGD